MLWLRKFSELIKKRGHIITLFIACHTRTCFLMTNQVLRTTVVLIWGRLDKPFI